MKNTILKTFVLGLGLLTVSAANAQEGDAVKPVKGKFVKIDADKDGKISHKEYATFRNAVRKKKGKAPKKGDFKKRFEQIDLNKDGFLDKVEFKNRKATKPPKKKTAE